MSQLSKVVSDLNIKLTVVVGDTNMTVAEIGALTQGQVISLDRNLGEPLKLYANGKLIGLCEAVAVNDKYGIKILELFPDKA